MVVHPIERQGHRLAGLGAGLAEGRTVRQSRISYPLAGTGSRHGRG